jgi:hypothetical protein
MIVNLPNCQRLQKMEPCPEDLFVFGSDLFAREQDSLPAFRSEIIALENVGIANAFPAVVRQHE